MSNKIKHFYEFGDFRFAPEEKCLWKNEELLSLPPKALEVLNLLLENRNKVVTREKLLDNVWEETFVDEGNLTVAVSNLRKTLEQESLSKEEFIQTVPKKGYRFVADVTEIFEDENGEPASLLGETGKEEKAGFEPLKPARESGKQDSGIRWHFVAIILLGVLFLSSFAMWMSYSRQSGLSTVPVNERSIKNVAVLPLKHLTAEDRILTIGLTDSLISRLGKLNRFAVRPLSAVEKFGASGKDALEFGKELKVDAVVVGTIQSVGNRLRLNVRLLDVRDGAQIWSKSYDETESDLFKLQDDLSLQVADNLIASISDEETKKLTERETEDTDAFKEYSRGQFYLAKRTKVDIEKAIGHFKKAVSLDAGYSRAYTGIANGYQLMSDSGFAYSKPLEHVEEIGRALDKALELKPNSAEAHASKGSFLAFMKLDYKGGNESFEKSIKINPNIAETHHWYAWALLAEKRFEDAKKELKLAQELDPTSLIIATEIGLPFVYQERYDEALPYFRDAVELDKDFPQARFRLWYGLFYSGQYEEAAKQLAAYKNLTSDKDPLYLLLYGGTLAKTGKEIKAREIFQELIKRRSGSEYISPMMLASLASVLGDKDQAIKYLEESLKERNDFLPYLEIAPEFKGIRNDQAFKDIVKRVAAR